MDAINGINSDIKIFTGDKTRKTNAGQAFYGIFCDKNIGVNGQIDEAVFQGEKGDCWLLSGILSLSYTEEGKELIKNSISQDENGDYEVYFKGLKKGYKISKDELEKNNVSTFKSGAGLKKSEYSTGDDDVLLIELAVEKAIIEDDIPIETVDGITGGSAYYLYKIFGGTEVNYASGEDKQELFSSLNYYNEHQNSCSATIGVIDGFCGLEDDHAYAVKDISRNELTLVNPWNTNDEVSVSIYDLAKHAGSYDLSMIDGSLFGNISAQSDDMC